MHKEKLRTGRWTVQLRGWQTRTNQEVTSFLAPCLRWWWVSNVCVPTGSSAPGWGAGLLAEEAVNGLLLWSDRRMLGPFLGGFWWCSSAEDRSLLPPFFSSVCLDLLPAFSPSLLEVGDIGLLFSTLPMLALSFWFGDPSNISVI